VLLEFDDFEDDDNDDGGDAENDANNREYNRRDSPTTSCLRCVAGLADCDHYAQNICT